eukprot:gene10224-12538_t
MRRLEQDIEVLRKFGGHITGEKWYKCFVNPIIGYVSHKEGNTDCHASLKIPIIRFTPPPLKEGQLPVVLPEDDMLIGYDGGAHFAYVHAELSKNSSKFYDWKFDTLTVTFDDGQ